MTALLVAEHETTMNAAGWLVLELARNHGLQSLLRDELQRVPAAVEERLRRDAPAHLFFRSATQPTELSGQHIETGDRGALVFAAANRDPAADECPAEFRLDRDGPRQPGLDKYHDARPVRRAGAASARPFLEQRVSVVSIGLWCCTDSAPGGALWADATRRVSAGSAVVAAVLPTRCRTRTAPT